MFQEISPGDPRLTWAGAISVQITLEGAMPWRIPYGEQHLFAEALVERAAMPAGVRLTFRTDSPWIRGRCQPFPERSPIDLFCNGQFVASVETADAEEFSFTDLSAGSKLVELWLPQYGPFQLQGLTLAADAVLTPAQSSSRPRWVTYGSSITQCRQAASPSQSWPAIVARSRGVDLTCLGYGGQCHLDPMVARMIRDREAELISLCLGINIYGGATLNPRTFGPGILGFVQIVREKHPHTPLLLLSPIFSPGRESTPNAVGFTLEMMRDEVAGAVQRLQAHGDEAIHYIDGLQIFDATGAHLLPDDLHPNAEGYRLMAHNFLHEAAPFFDKVTR